MFVCVCYHLYVYIPLDTQIYEKNTDLYVYIPLDKQIYEKNTDQCTWIYIKKCLIYTDIYIYQHTQTHTHIHTHTHAHTHIKIICIDRYRGGDPGTSCLVKSFLTTLEYLMEKKI